MVGCWFVEHYTRFGSSKKKYDLYFIFPSFKSIYHLIRKWLKISNVSVTLILSFPFVIWEDRLFKIRFVKVTYLFFKIWRTYMTKAMTTTNKNTLTVILKCNHALESVKKINLNYSCIPFCRFSPGTPVSSINKTNRHDITETLLKVALRHHPPSQLSW
jgi:hypothetical protein